MLKPYHKLSCANLEEIQNQSLNWLNKHYDLSNQSSLKTDLWLKINYIDFLKHNNALIDWFKELKLIPREIAVTVINNPTGADLHIDELPTVAKINIPIINYQNVVNEWYNADLSNIEKVTNQFGAEYYDLTKIDISKCKLIDSIIPLSPIVFNSQIPHRVVPLPKATFPRVMLTCMFVKEPTYFLEY